MKLHKPGAAGGRSPWLAAVASRLDRLAGEWLRIWLDAAEARGARRQKRPRAAVGRLRVLPGAGSPSRRNERGAGRRRSSG